MIERAVATLDEETRRRRSSPVHANKSWCWAAATSAMLMKKKQKNDGVNEFAE